MINTLPPQVFAQAIKNVYHNIPVRDAAAPQGVIHPLVCALQKMIYDLVGWELPPHLQTKTLQDIVDVNQPEMLKILASISYIGNDQPLALSARSAVHFDSNRPFQFQGHAFQFVQERANLFLVQCDSDDASGAGRGATRRWDLGELSPKKLKSQALRALIRHENRQGKAADLTQFSLHDVDDITQFNFRHVQINAKNLRQMAGAVASNQMLPAGTHIDLRGASLVAGPSANIPRHFGQFIIDKQLALQLIENGASAQKVVEQYVQSQNMFNERDFDIACFDLAKIDCTNLDLRQANMRTVINRGNPAELVSLKKATTTPYVTETLRLATSDSALLFDSVPGFEHPMVVDGSYQFSETLSEFRRYAADLEKLHAAHRTLGNISLRTARLYNKQVFYVHEDIHHWETTPITDEFTMQYFVKSKDVDLGVVYPRKLSPKKQDQYDFFGVMIQAATGKAQLELLPPNDRYHPDDIEVLWNRLPFNGDQKVYSDWIEFMLHPDSNELHYSLSSYLNGSDRMIKSFPDQKPVPAILPLPALSQAPATTTTPTSTPQPAPGTSFKAGFEVENLVTAKRLGTYQFDVAHFIGLAKSRQASMVPTTELSLGTGPGGSDQTVQVMIIEKDSLQDCVYFRNNQLCLDPERQMLKITDPARFQQVAKSIQLDFFSTMIKVGVPDYKMSRPCYTGKPGEIYLLGEVWDRATAVAFVNKLRCTLQKKYELALFLIDPVKYSLHDDLESYLTPFGLPVQIEITVEYLKSLEESSSPAASGASEPATDESGPRQVIQPSYAQLIAAEYASVPEDDAAFWDAYGASRVAKQFVRPKTTPAKKKLTPVVNNGLGLLDPARKMAWPELNPPRKFKAE